MDSKKIPKKRQRNSKLGSAAKKIKKNSKEEEKVPPVEKENGAHKGKNGKGHDDPNQTVKASFTKANRMPPYVNDWGKKILSLYCKYCIEQESYNLMVIRNLATTLANFIFFKEYIEEKAGNQGKEKNLEQNGPCQAKKRKVEARQEQANEIEEQLMNVKPKFDQQFYYGCLSSFNSGAQGEKVPKNNMRVGCSIKSFRDHVVEFSDIGCPNNLKLSRVFDDTTSIAANQLAVNAEEYFKRQTKVLVKLLVQHCNPSSSKRSANTVAKLLMMEDFHVENKRIPLRYAMKKKLSDVYHETVDFAKYEVQASEMDRWLFFHRLLFSFDAEYITRCAEQKQWTPIAKANKRTHVDMNETQWTKMFSRKLSKFLKCLQKRQDAFQIFNYPGFPGSPLAKLFPIVKKGGRKKASDKLTDKDEQRQQRRLEKKQATLLKKVEEINTILKDQKAFENYVSLLQCRNTRHQARPKPPPNIHIPLDQKDLAWGYLLPSLHRVIKGNVFKRFRTFRHISTNGVDMSIYLINENKKLKTTHKTKPTDLRLSDLNKRRIIGLDPGVHSLATSTYSNFLHKSDISQQGLRHSFYFKTTQGRMETQVSSKEIRNKADLACGPLAKFRRYHTNHIKDRLMNISASHTSTCLPSTSASTLSPLTPQTFFSTYPNHKSDPKSVIEFTALNNTFLLESCNILSRKCNLYWSWFSYRYMQIQYSAITKRIISPAFAETPQAIKSLRKHSQLVIKSSQRSHIKNRKPRIFPSKLFPTVAQDIASKNSNGKIHVKRTSKSYIKRHPHIRQTVKKHLRKPWLPDSILFKLIQRHSKIKLENNPILIAFGNGSRNVGFIRGHKKGSAEKVFNSLVQLLGCQNVIDASEFRTTIDCHFCGSQVTDEHWINKQISNEPRAPLYGKRLHRRVRAAQLSPMRSNPNFWFGRKRSSFEMRKCNVCNRVFNRDANAAINILNLFIHQVHQNSNPQ